LREEVKIPIYFVLESVEINEYYKYIENESSNQADSSAFQSLIDSIITNGFQFVINAAQSKAIVQSNNEFQAVNIQGKLNGILKSNDINTVNFNDMELNQASKKIPTIIITAHYDSFGLATVLIIIEDFFLN
jgi:hypothetical protein